MSCCDRKRKALVLRPSPAAVPSPPPSAAPGGVGAPVVFVGSGAYLATGATSRVVYRFSAGDAAQWVDQGDVAGLMSTGLFRMGAGPVSPNAAG